MFNNTSTTHSPGFLTPRDLIGRLQVSRRHLDRLIAERGFPRPIYLIRRCRRWRVEEVNAFVANLNHDVEN